MTQVIHVNDYQDEGGAVVPFDAYSASEMAFRLEDLKSRMDVVQRFFKDVMIEGQDYGVIPGTDKPALLKPGAEKLCELYGYSPMMKVVEEDKDLHSGFYMATVTMQLVSRKTGAIVAEGTGSANTHESRYRWRWLYPEKLPAGLDPAHLVKRSGNKKGGGTWTQYRVENDDPFSLWNTVLKMAKKRALVDVALSATRSSGLFTQDPEAFDKWVEDGGDGGEETGTRKPPVKTPQRRSAKGQADAPPDDESAIPAWSAEDLGRVLADHTLVLKDLSPVLEGECTKETFPDLIDGWLRANPGKSLTDLARATVEYHTGPPQEAPAEQASLMS